MFEIKTTITSIAEAERAAAVFAAIAETFSDDSPETGADAAEQAAPTGRRTRRSRARNVAEPATSVAAAVPDLRSPAEQTDPAALYQALGGALPAPTADPAPVAPEPAAATAPTPTTDPETALVEFRQIAQARGALWLRAVLEKHGATRLSGLPLDAVLAAIADPDEAAKPRGVAA